MSWEDEYSEEWAIESEIEHQTLLADWKKEEEKIRLKNKFKDMVIFFKSIGVKTRNIKKIMEDIYIDHNTKLFFLIDDIKGEVLFKGTVIGKY